jgi:L-cysteine S-thiosulfotransferase
VGAAGTLKKDRPDLTVGRWLPTLFDYIDRAMPIPAPHTLSADDVYALTPYIRNLALRVSGGRAPKACSPLETIQPMRHPGDALTDTTSTRPLLMAALTIGVLASTAPASAQSAAEGQKLAFDRGKGNCLTCHVIRGGDLPGTIGPELKDIKSKYPDRNDLVAIVTDETKRNPQTVMPPFGRNRILTEQEINAVVDFLQTL